MSDPYPQHPSYPPASSNEATNTTTNSAYYSPPDGVYQYPPYDYDPQQFYNQHTPPAQDPAYSSQYDVSQIPRSYPSQWAQTPTDAVPPPQAAYDADRLGPHYEPPVRRGSNAEYYNLSPAEQPQAQAENQIPRQAEPEGDGDGDGEGERSLGGAVLGGATGYYLGHKKDHGFLGAVGGALLGTFVGDKLKDRKEGDEVVVEDEERDSEYSYHSRRSRRSSSHGYGHGHHHHHHHHHHHGGHHGHHRSRSRHSGFEEEY